MRAAFITTLCLSFLACANNNTSTDNDQMQEALMKTLEEFNSAFREGNVAALESMITDRYIHTNGTSPSINKDQWLSYLRKRKEELESGALQVPSYSMDEMRIEYYGNTAIVSNRILSTTKRDSISTENAHRVTSVWIYESGKWKRAGFHDGRIM